MSSTLVWFGGAWDGADDTPRVRRQRILAEHEAHSSSTEESHRLDALRAGDERVFHAIYAEYSTTLWEFTAYLTGDPELARDIVQDVFVSLWTRRTTLDIHETMRVYLFRAVRNHVSKQRRHAAVVRKTTPDATEVISGAMTSSTAADPVNALDMASLEQAVDAIIHDMPAARRTAALLRLRHGLSDTEAASIMGVSVEAVRMHVSRARAALRPLVEQFREQ